MDDLRFTIAPADLSEDDFMAKYGGIYEHAPWVAARLFGAGLGPQDSRLSIFAGRMADIVDAAGHDVAAVRIDHFHVKAGWLLDGRLRHLGNVLANRQHVTLELAVRVDDRAALDEDSGRRGRLADSLMDIRESADAAAGHVARSQAQHCSLY